MVSINFYQNNMKVKALVYVDGKLVEQIFETDETIERLLQHAHIHSVEVVIEDVKAKK